MNDALLIPKIVCPLEFHFYFLKIKDIKVPKHNVCKISLTAFFVKYSECIKFSLEKHFTRASHITFVKLKARI